MPNFLTTLNIFRPFTTFFPNSTAVVPLGSNIPNLPPNAEIATFAAGCFWGVEHIFRKHFLNNGLLDARVGYVGGTTESPTYRAICSGSTGHAEGVQLLYDEDKLKYEELVKFFFLMHDPTTLNRQGPDLGTQYRSAIFASDEEQKAKAEEIKKKANDQWWNGKIVTEVVAPGNWKWWDAEEYHQLYLDKNPMGYECPSHYVRSLGEFE